MSGLQASMSFPLLSYTMSNLEEGKVAGSKGLPHTIWTPSLGEKEGKQ